jgi:hypothetical protein
MLITLKELENITLAIILQVWTEFRERFIKYFDAYYVEYVTDFYTVSRSRDFCCNGMVIYTINPAFMCLYYSPIYLAWKAQ